jgi:hypothetical protein
LFEDITTTQELGEHGRSSSDLATLDARRRSGFTESLTRWLLLKWTLPVEFGGTRRAGLCRDH